MRDNNIAPGKNPNESAIVHDNGNRNGYTINFALINTKAYHNRFENLTKRKSVNEELYKQAIKILGRRSGTEYEELIVLDARKGTLLAENFSAVADKRPFQCGLSEMQHADLEQRGEKFITLHNHPNSSFPSPADIRALFSRSLQTDSVVICHDGTIYYLEKLKNFNDIRELIARTARETDGKLSGRPMHIIEAEISLEVIKKLRRSGILTFKEVP